MPQISPITWPFTAIALIGLPALAQVNTPPTKPASAAVATAHAAAAALPYRSVFDGYQPFSDEKVRPWKDSNHTVEKIGGWRAYAKEVAQPEPADQQAPAATPAAPAPPAAASDPHAGHGKH